MIRRLALPTVIALLLAACGQQDAPERTNLPTASPDELRTAVDRAEGEVAAEAAAPLDAAVAGAWRTPAFVERDSWRNPRETLQFFGIAPDMRVVEITPGGGWYTEILAPYLREQGQWIGAIVAPEAAANERARDYYVRVNQQLRDKLEASPEFYDRGQLVEFNLQQPQFGEPGSVDAVLTFRNVHNWTGGGYAQAMFNGFFEVLRPGGVLGVVEHRADQDVPEGDRSGYISEQQVIALATSAGFVLDERSDINANPADTKDHPNGVWTLPPSLNVPEGEDPERFRGIGESDRMTLRFRKPG
jgi:predicted methyltransferase